MSEQNYSDEKFELAYTEVLKYYDRLEEVYQKKLSLFDDFLMKLTIEESAEISGNIPLILLMVSIINTLDKSKKIYMISKSELEDLCAKFNFLFILSLGVKLGFFDVDYKAHDLKPKEWGLKLTEFGKKIAPDAPEEFHSLVDYIQETRVFQNCLFKDAFENFIEKTKKQS